jgi:hypothetical protein
MAILEKEVFVTLCPQNIEYFDRIKYEIPRKNDKWGRYSVVRGSKLLVKVDDLPDGSNVKVTKICDMNGCGKHIPNQSYNQILKHRNNGDGKDYCKKCSVIKRAHNRRNNVKYDNSLETFAKNNNRTYLLKEFSEKNIKSPNQISYGTSYEYLWKCLDCKSEYLMKVSSRTSSNKSNCPYCTGVKVNRTNCLWTTHPEIAKLLKNPQRGYELTAGSNKKETFICVECFFEKIGTVYNVVNQGFICNRCSDGISYPEKLMMNILDQLNINYSTQKRFNWSNNKKYDFYVHSLNCIIETHGSQHYIQTSGNWGKLDETQDNDRLKEKLGRENGVENYFIIDCKQSNLEYIKSSILTSGLSDIINFNKIEWKKAHEYSLHTLVKEVCEIWNKGVKSSKNIGKLVNLAPSTVVIYLNKGTKLGWCDYDPKEVKRINGKLYGKRNSIKIVQLTMEGKYIRDWESASTAGKELGINQGNITLVCRGKYKYSGGFKWAYKKDYENRLNNLVI